MDILQNKKRPGEARSGSEPPNPYMLSLRRSDPTAPSRPLPSNTSVPGSGVARM